MDVITGAELALYLHTSQDATVDQLTGYANTLITEEWNNPADPAPTRVKMIALEVAARAWRNPRGLESWTRSVDDASRTERLPRQLARAGIFLTDEEKASLNGAQARRPKSIALRVPGWSP